MFGPKWKRFWKSFDHTMGQLDDMVQEQFESGDGLASGNCCTTCMTNKNGDIAINGHIRSIRINGRLLRLPPEVMKP